METTLTIAANTNCDPFRVMEADADDVIMLINYFIDRATEKPNVRSQTTAGGIRRVRVTDATASGGWF